MQTRSGGWFCAVGPSGAARGDQGACVPLYVGERWRGLLDLLGVLEPLGGGESGSFLRTSFLFLKVISTPNTGL